MKKALIRFLSFILCFTVMLVSMSDTITPIKTEADSEFAFLDYTRIHGAKTGKVYPVELSFGSMKLNGRLRYTGTYSDKEIDDAVKNLFAQNGIDESDIKYAQSIIDKWKKEEKVTNEDAIEVGLNIAKIMGVDTPFQAANEVYKFIKNDISGWDAVKNLSNQIVSGRVEDVVTAARRAIAVTLITNDRKAMREAGTLLYKYLNTVDDINADKIALAKFSKSYRTLINMVVNTTQVSVEQWKKDKERWKLRVDAVKATNFINSFYDALNEYLRHSDPEQQNWVLTVAGTQKRLFNFFGSPNNVQYTTIAISAAKDPIPSNVYVSKSDRANLPFGGYTGFGMITLEHDLSNFDYDFWNLPIGILKKNWLNELIVASSIAGGLRMNETNETSITRKLVAEKLSFYIPGGYSQQYSSNIPRTVGNRDVITTIPLSDFEDKVDIKATHLLDYEWGLASEDGGALDYVQLRAHAEMSNGNLSLIFDKTKALVWILGTTFADIDQNYVSGGSSWDDNIWADMSNGIRLKIKFR